MNGLRSNIYKVLLFACLIAWLSACKSSKTAVATGTPATSKANEQLVDDILKAETDFKTISGKITVELIAGNNTSGMKVNSQLKIVRDQVIQLSLRMPLLGTEVFRLDITPDSVFVIDRLNKCYAIEDLSKLEKGKNIQFNYANMQALFTNALFVPGKAEITKSDYNKYDISLEDGKHNLRTKDRTGMLYHFVVDANDRIVATNIRGEEKNYALLWTYADFVKDDGGYIYPTQMAANVNVEKKRFSLVMSYPKLDINKEIRVDRNLPSSYEKVSIMKILKNYIK